MHPVGTSLWRRHHALELVIAAWPELERDDDRPPELAVLARLLERVGMTIATKAEARAGYEASVVGGRLPTRAGSWHDVFNALAFVRFPLGKAALHRRCFELQTARAGQQPRTREEDALTLIDEASLLVAGSAEAVAEFDELRESRSPTMLDPIVRAHGLTVHVFGHALYEHLALGRPSINAGVVTVTLTGENTQAELDRTLAARIAEAGFPSPRMGASLAWPHPIIDTWLASLTDC